MPRSSRRGARRDHPRSRGVYTACRSGPINSAGSSPLARGLLDMMVINELNERIIPARAGFTPVLQDTRIQLPDHPRSRGVYTRQPRSSRRPEGSSPLARGLPHQPARRPRQPRIIPARAGFTIPDPVTLIESPDHPRSRGVYLIFGNTVSATKGSSPLARGLPRFFRRRACPCRIIPARAGFTVVIITPDGKA